KRQSPTQVDAAHPDEQAAQNRADGHGDADGASEVAERAAALTAAEVLLNHADALWVQQAGPHTLNEACRIERVGVRREAGGHRGEGEDHHADHEHSATAE